MSHCCAPIGIFDSGVGGLSIARAIRTLLPGESIHYVADQRYNPYGEQDRVTIERRSAKVVEFLLEQGCKAIVVACNTATVNAIDTVRDRFDVPFVGVEPGIKPAAERSRSGVVGVLATRQTLASESYLSLKRRVAAHVEVQEQACPAFVELVERGHLDGGDVRAAVERNVAPLLNAGADQIVLGCTHFSFLSPEIERLVDGRAALIDTAEPVASELLRQLTLMGAIAKEGAAEIRFFSSASVQNPCRVSRLWGGEVSIGRLPDLDGL